MSTNGGSLQGIPPPSPRSGVACTPCGVMLDSPESMSVHQMHYHENPPSRGGGWGVPSNNNSGGVPIKSELQHSPSDSDNNNHPKQHLQHLQVSKNSSPLHNTVSAAADSSDNQRSTPQPLSGGNGIDHRATAYIGYNSNSSPYQQLPPASELPYPYMHPYEYFHHPNMDYGLPPAHFSQPPQHADYKPVPSSRYHPYHSLSHPQPHQQLSPRIVSSSSPSQNNGLPSSLVAPPGHPTPSPSPKQCDKCGYVCETSGQLSDHYAAVHQHGGQSDTVSLSRTGSGDDTAELSNNFQYTHYVKEEPPCDILDLDSQKMVYPPQDGTNHQGPLPPMHSLHPMQRPAMLWPHEHHSFIPPHSQEPKPSLYTSMKSEYSTNVGIKQEYSPPALHHPQQVPLQQQQQQQQQQQDSKSFNNEVSGNQVTTSPSEFPSTTTPQENGAQFRTFEAATSSLPSNTQSTKSSSWKSNEARRPKTYNCTACNKWFTSSGHLKRHYNTTLHKNAVKSSGLPDPATMPISVHHHPSRDQNKNHHHRGSPAQAPQPVPPEPPRSPEYSPQYTPPLGFQQAGQAFQQYGTAIHSNSGGPPNGQAGPSVLASQPRGLLIYTTTTGTQHQTELQEQEPNFMHQTPQLLLQLQPLQPPSNTISSAEQYNIINPITINTNITTQLYPVPIPSQEELQQNYHTIIGNSSSDLGELSSDTMLEYIDHMDHQSNDYHGTSIPCATALRRFTGGAAMYQQGDTAPPFSPDMPDSYKNVTTTLSSHRNNPHGSMTLIGHAHEGAPQSPLSMPDSPNMSTGTPTAPAGTNTTVTSTYGSTIMNANADGSTTIKAKSKRKPASKQRSSASSITTKGLNVEQRCVQCDKVFNKACYLTQHNKTFHSGEKPFKCRRCGKRFPCGRSQADHFAKHGGEKPYKCDQCPKQFNHKTDLRRHMCLHSGAKPYKCDSCGKGFIRKDHMMKHSETHTRKSALLALKLQIKSE